MDRKTLRRFQYPWRSTSDIQAEVDEELAFHLDMRTEELMRSGMPPEEARAQALQEFGDVDRARRTLKQTDTQVEQRRQRKERLGTLRQDLRFSLRMLGKSPGFTLLAVLTLALGVGANTAIFSIVNGALLRPLPYPESDRIVTLWTQSEGAGRTAVADENFRDWQDLTRSFEVMAYHWNHEFGGRVTILGAETAVRSWATGVSRDFFDVFRVQPALGRAFLPEEQTPGGPSVAVVSHSFWHNHLASDPNVLGRTIEVVGDRYEIIGVMPAGFHYPAETDVWVTLERMEPIPSRTARNWAAVGRLRDGATVASAQAEMDGLDARLRAQYGEESGAAGARLTRLQDELVGDLRQPLLLLFGAAALVLLIACTNLASTLLARGTAREREVAIRTSLGAGRMRLVRQLLTESVVLALLGAVAGIALAALVLRSLTALGPASLGHLASGGLDLAVLLFALALALITALIFGLLPALRTSDTEIGEVLRAGTRGSSERRQRGLWGVLVGGEVALAILLLIGSGLLIQSFRQVLNVDSGFDPQNVLTADLSLPESRYQEDGQIAGYYRQLFAEMERLPGVEEVGLIQHIPLGGQAWGSTFEIDGQGEDSGWAQYRVVGPGYFRAMGINLLRGRHFSDSDRADGPHVAIVNQTLADREWPGQDPIGQRVRNIGNEIGRYRDEWATVVGVVADVRAGSLTGQPVPELYVNVLQRPARAREAVLTLRTSVPPASLTGPARDRVRSVDPDVPVDFATMSARVIQSVADRRFTMLVLTAFAGIALVLAAVGIYGVVAYSVARRTREIGIRLALGAEPGEVRALVQRSTMLVVLLGIAAGIAGAIALGRVLQSLPFGVNPLDPTTFVAVTLVLGGVAWLASYIPARRATHVDPMITMRAE